MLQHFAAALSSSSLQGAVVRSFACQSASQSIFFAVPTSIRACPGAGTRSTFSSSRRRISLAARCVACFRTLRVRERRACDCFQRIFRWHPFVASIIMLPRCRLPLMFVVCVKTTRTVASITTRHGGSGIGVLPLLLPPCVYMVYCVQCTPNLQCIDFT